MDNVKKVYSMIADFCRTFPYPPIWIFESELIPTKRLNDIGLDASDSAELVFELGERFKVNLDFILAQAETRENLPQRQEGNYHMLTPLEIANYISEHAPKENPTRQ